MITKTFTKQYLRCPGAVQVAVRDLITSLENATSLREPSDIKKLAGFKDYYRIRLGQYRIELKQEKPKVILICVMERSQIYKAFPPQ